MNYVYEDGGKVYATIFTNLNDPRDLSKRFAAIGYDVIAIHHIGANSFQYVMTVQGVKS